MKRSIMVLFVVTAFMSSSLLFLSEPMVAKMLLPTFGGTPAVWNTCMVFFQTLLLAGYAYTHWSLKGLGIKRQVWLHVGLLVLSVATLPLVLPGWAGTNAQSQPGLRLLVLLAVIVGVPFFILAASGPLLQRWFAATKHPHAQRPYFLYAAGNLGSFIALLAYPLLIEPHLSLRQQSRIWSAGYIGLIVLNMACIIALAKYRGTVKKQKTDAPKSAAISWPRRLAWVLYAFVPSSLMLGITTKITVDIAPVPLLWAIPLALYLLTFVIAFGRTDPKPLAQKSVLLAGPALAVAFMLTGMPLVLSSTVTIVIYFTCFTLLALACHAKLAAGRPEAARLTEFYLWVAIGGGLGGVFNALVAPLVLPDIYELPMALLAMVPVLVGVRSLRKVQNKDLLIGLLPGLCFLATLAFIRYVHLVAVVLPVCALYFLFRKRPVAFGLGMVPLFLVPLALLSLDSTVLTERTFFAVIKVRQQKGLSSLLHGTTVHGSQYLDKKRSRQPTAYYHQAGPFGDAMRLCRTLSGCQRIGVLGEGVGTIAAYGKPGDTVTFFEIDPAIIRIAADSQYFTYVSDSKAHIKEVLGDGRLTLARSTDKYDVLVIDAFSSDAVPTHLLTREAIQLYRQKLTPNGMIIINISNRTLKLEPLLAATARDQGMHARIRFDAKGSPDPAGQPSQWVVFANHAEDFATLPQSQWQPLKGKAVRVWTDDYSNILDTLR